MFNLMRTELFKLRKSRSFQIILLACTALGIMNAVLYIFMGRYFSLDAMDELFNGPAGSFMTNGGGIMAYLNEMTGQIFMFNTFDTQLHYCAIMIFTAMFVVAEYTSGALKIVVGKGFKRYQVYLSKFIVVNIAAFVMAVIYFIFSVIPATAYWGFGPIESGFAGRLLIYIGSQLLIQIAIVSFAMMVSAVSRSNGISIAINILLLTLVPSLVSGINIVLGNHVDLNNYWFIPQITKLSGIDVTMAEYANGSLIGLIYLGICLVIGLIVFNRQDIK